MFWFCTQLGKASGTEDLINEKVCKGYLSVLTEDLLV